MAFDARAIVTAGAFPSATFWSVEWGRALLTRAWAFDLAEFEPIRTMFERVTEVIQAIRETAPMGAELISEPVGVERVR